MAHVGRPLTKTEVIRAAADFIDKIIVIAHKNGTKAFMPNHTSPSRGHFFMIEGSKGLISLENEVSQETQKKCSEKIDAIIEDKN